MKTRIKSESSFDELQAIIIPYEESNRTINVSGEIKKLLEKYGNKMRQKDGHPYSLQGSFATSRKNTYVVGLRYTKDDGSLTEDHFLFEKGKCLIVLKDRELEKILPEYEGAHKWQPL